MSQVDDWSDGYTSDYLRDLNTRGPASANVPRTSSVVSHQVQYQPPVAQTEAKTNDTPLYDNDGGFNPGPQRLVSAPARPFRGNATAAQRAARPKPAAKKKTQSASKQQTQPEYRTGGARTPEENEITRSAAEHRAGADLGQLSSQALDAAARFLPAFKLLGFGAGAGSADTASTDRPSYMGAAGTMADNFARTLPQPSAASRQTAPESSSTEGQFKNMPWYEDAKAHYEAVKKNMDDYGSALGMLKSTWDDIPWWAMMNPAGGPARAYAAEGRRLYGPVVERLLAPKGPVTGGASEARTTLTSVDEGLPVGYSLLRESPKGTSAWRGAAADYGVSPAGGSVKLDLNGVPGAAGREAAAAGEQAAGAGGAGEAAGTAARQGAGEAAGTLSAYNRQQYRNYINMVQNDPKLADLVPSTLHRAVGNAARSIDSLSDAELSAFYKALNDVVNQRWITSLFVGGL